MRPASPYLNSKEAADYLRFRTMTGFYSFRHRTPSLKAYHRGGTLLFKQSDLDRALDEERRAPEPRLRKVAG